MTVSALSGGQSPWDIMQQRRAALQQMEAAVQSGDIKSAQQGLATVKALSPATPSGGIGKSGSDPDGDGDNPFRTTMKTDLSALEMAVESGNITDAQGALSKLKSDKQGLEAQTQAQASSPGAAVGTDLVKLLEAALKGDTTGTQSAANALQGDLQSLLGTSASEGSGAAESTTSGGSLGDDLKALAVAGQGTDANATQQALQKVLQDLQQSASGVAGGHHHHGHHSHVAAQYEQTMNLATPQGTSAATETASDATAATSQTG